MEILRVLVGPAVLYSLPGGLWLYLAYYSLRCGHRGLKAGQGRRAGLGRALIGPTLLGSWGEGLLALPWIWSQQGQPEFWAGFLAGLSLFYTNFGLWAGLRFDTLSAARRVFGWVGACAILQVILLLILPGAEELLLLSPWPSRANLLPALAAHWLCGLFLYLLVPEHKTRAETEVDGYRPVSFIWTLIPYFALVWGPALLSKNSYFDNRPAASVVLHVLFWLLLANQRGLRMLGFDQWEKERPKSAKDRWNELWALSVAPTYRQLWVFSPLLLGVLCYYDLNRLPLALWAWLILLSHLTIVAWGSLSLAFSTACSSSTRAFLLSAGALGSVLLGAPMMDQAFFAGRPVMVLADPLLSAYWLCRSFFESEASDDPLLFAPLLAQLAIWGLSRRWGMAERS